MSKTKPLSLLFFFLITSMVIWLMALFTKDLYPYLVLKSSASALIEKWEIKELSSGKFALTAHYLYEIEGKPFSGKTTFRSRFLNEQSALLSLQRLHKQSWKVWYHPKKGEISSLEKFFPVKNGIRAFIGLSVVVYFYFLMLPKLRPKTP